MKRLLGGGLAFSLAAIGSMALAGPTSAEEPIFPGGVELEAELLPGDVAAPGDALTASSLDRCTLGESEGEGEGDLYWAMGSLDEQAPRDEGVAPLDEVGGWEVTFTAPDDPGDYVFLGICAREGFPQEPIPVARLDEEVREEEIRFEYYLLPFTVEGPTTPTTTIPDEPEAEPVPPVRAQPTFTG